MSFIVYICTAIAIIFVLEGLLYAIFPDGMKRIISVALTMENADLRRFGWTSVAVGFLTIFLINAFS